jgi:serine/threonine-protein kinase
MPDARSDVYALGAILYELVCERPLYDLADMPLYQAVRIVRDEAPAPPRVARPELSAALEAVVLRALAREPARRWPTAAALSDALGRVLEERRAGQG